MSAREVGEEIRGELRARLGCPIGLFDSDPELDDHDPDFGAHIQVTSTTRIVVVDIPHRSDHYFWGRWASDDEYHEQPILRRDEVVNFMVGALA